MQLAVSLDYSGALWQIVIHVTMDRYHILEKCTNYCCYDQSIHITNIQEVVIDGKELGIEGYLDIGLIDTMSDLIVNFIGAIIFSTMGYFYVKHRNSKSLVKGFVPEPWSKEKHSDIED